jgi:hypothetical protein
MKKLVLTFSALAMLGGGCGGGGDDAIDEGPSSATKGTAEPTAMKATVTKADGLTAALAAGNGEQLAGAAVSLSVGAMGAVKGGTANALAVDRMIADMTAEGTTGTKTCTATGCTFDGFGSSGFKVSGSITASDAMGGGKHVVWKLTGSGDNLGGGSSAQAQNVSFTFTWKGDLTVSATSLNGAAGATWTGSGMVNGQSFSFDYGSILKFQSVTIDNHCPTAGSVYGKWWLVAHAGGQDQSQAVEATHTFMGCVR